MKFQKSHLLTDYEKYSRLHCRIIGLYDALESIEPQNVKLLSFYSYIREICIQFPDEQTEEDFIKTIGCRRNARAESMLVKYIEALEAEAKRRFLIQRQD